MTKTSHVKNRPFDFKIIDLIEPHPILYQRQNGLSTYKHMKAKTRIWEEIAAKMGADVQFCISRWNNLRNQFQKELRQCRYLCPKLGVIKKSTWPYLHRLKFLENTVVFNRPSKPTVPKQEENEIASSPEWRRESFSDDNSQTVEISNENEQAVVQCMAQDEIHCTEEDFTNNARKMTALLNGFDMENRMRVERRIMAFLCKCQLRALVNEDVDDLTI